MSPLVKVATRIAFERRRGRQAHPDGRFDQAGRWYPTEEEDAGDISSRVRSPSRAFPWSYMGACRTRRHCKVLVELALAGEPVPRDISTAVFEASRIDDFDVAIMTAKAEAELSK